MNINTKMHPKPHNLAPNIDNLGGYNFLENDTSENIEKVDV
jgi:hypothetical protein